MPKDKKQKVHHLGIFKKNDVVQTPPAFYNLLDKVYHFDFDPCPLNPQFDGLSVDWGQRNFVNPPFSQISKWVAKAVVEQKKGKTSVLLITLRTSTKYWFQHVFPNATQIFCIRKGICFVGYTSPLPISLALVVFAGRNAAAADGDLRDDLPALGSENPGEAVPGVPSLPLFYQLQVGPPVYVPSDAGEPSAGVVRLPAEGDPGEPHIGEGHG